MSETQFVDIIKQNEGIIFKISTFYTDHSDDQKDLYQEIVAKLWTAFPSFRGESKPGTWIYRVALNTAITRLRKEKRREGSISIDQMVIQIADPQEASIEEQLRELYASIETLGDLDKGIVLLYLEDKKYEEIAEIIGITVSNVGTRLTRAKQKLRERMTNSEHSERKEVTHEQ